MASHGLKFQARAIAAVAQPGDGGKPQWLAGTTALREENEVQVLRLDDQDALRPAASYVHASEIWSIAASPADARQLATVYNEGGSYRAAVWAMPDGGRELRRECGLDGAGEARAVHWHAREHERLATVEAGCLVTWRLADGGAKEAGRAQAGRDGDAGELWAGAWSSHDASRFCTAAGRGLQLWDLRAMQPSGGVPEAHAAPVRDADLSHKSEHLLASAGEDCRVRVWDLRRLGKPAAEAAPHAHWAWQAKFHPQHDCLIATSGSAGQLRLLHLPGLGGPAPEQAKGRGLPAAEAGGDCVSFSCHAESVYGVAWARAADAWAFASVSHDGRVAASRVPSSLKYKVLI